MNVRLYGLFFMICFVGNPFCLVRSKLSYSVGCPFLKLDYSFSYAKITEVNLYVLVYRLFHEDFSPIVETNLDLKFII